MAIPKGMFAVATILQEQVPWAAGSFSPPSSFLFFRCHNFCLLCTACNMPRELVYWNNRADDRGATNSETLPPRRFKLSGGNDFGAATARPTRFRPRTG